MQFTPKQTIRLIVPAVEDFSRSEFEDLLK